MRAADPVRSVSETWNREAPAALAPGLLVLEPEPQDFRNANACLRGWSTSLRAADALHLAIASGRGASLCSLDAPFVAAAQQLGLDAQLLGA